MYYHTQQLKYTIYDKIYPAPITTVDEYFLRAYEWLGKYCGGYCPQIWLARSRQAITGYRNINKSKKTKYFGTRRNFEPDIMFAFDIIKGFPVDYEIWCFLLNTLVNCPEPIKNGDKEIIQNIEEMLKDFKNDPSKEYDGDPTKLPPNDILYKWVNSKNYDDFLNRYLFVENDQVVVPCLNLKAAKEIYCRNEKQVKILRRMGFIEDRIKILNSERWRY